uniref:Uncharacterized protein n=1 Tax=Myotis myotis TaxID=51298 RepID=A0A7J7U5I0_MYOMY|nr:hypothetical protein mMyoMyo1_008869 [Myotis myotis]
MLLRRYYKNSRMVSNASCLSQGFIPIQRGSSRSLGQHVHTHLAEPILTGEVGLKGEQGQVTLWDLRNNLLFAPSPATQVGPQGIPRKSYPCWYFSHSGTFYTPLPADTFVRVVGCTLTKLPRAAHQPAAILKVAAWGSDLGAS